MKSINFLIILNLLTLSWLSNVQAAIQSEQINYQIDGQSFSGYLSYDDSITGKRPGVLVVHEWWGHNAYARKRADKLAQLGYTAFALDMYGTGKLAQHPDAAKSFMQTVTSNMWIAEQRFDAAKNLLQQHSMVTAEKIAAIGYCFGGSVILHMARQGSDLAAVISFHSSLSTTKPAHKDAVKAQVLVLNGADDPFVTTAQIDAFKQEMQAANASFQFINYPGVKHSFSNPDADIFGQRFNMPLAYNAEADSDSWQRMQVLLEQVFNQ